MESKPASLILMLNYNCVQYTSFSPRNSRAVQGKARLHVSLEGSAGKRTRKACWFFRAIARAIKEVLLLL